jgi:alpha-tubulin suppressor-like RCC1 family protein
MFTQASATVAFSDPVAIAGVTSAIAVGVGATHACALRSDGKVLCWGSNFNHQLGRDAPRTSESHPAGEVAPLPAAVHLAVGGFFTCVIAADSSVRCWGTNFAFELAQEGNVTSNPVPTAVAGVSAYLLSAGEQHTCALEHDGRVVCWGDNTRSQSHPTAAAIAVAPMDVGLGGLVDVAAGFDTTCVLTADGLVACWGNGLPFAGVAGVSNAASIAASVSGTCALLADGTIKCWGTSSTTLSQPPVTNAIELGGQCALLVGGSTRCFSGTTAGAFRPDAAPSKARGLALGANHSCARRAIGEIVCWGENGSSQLGDGTVSDRPTPVTVLNSDNHPATGASIAAGGSHSCLRTPAGGVQCWGDNAFGQTGDPVRGGIRPDLFTVIDQGTTPLTNVVAVTNGTSHSCALLANGRAKCWGSNADGQLGDGTRTTP